LARGHLCTLQTRSGGKSVPTNSVLMKGKVLLVDIGTIGELV
jgi:hypothetical protein